MQSSTNPIGGFCVTNYKPLLVKNAHDRTDIRSKRLKYMNEKCILKYLEYLKFFVVVQIRLYKQAQTRSWVLALDWESNVPPSDSCIKSHSCSIIIIQSNLKVHILFQPRFTVLLENVIHMSTEEYSVHKHPFTSTLPRALTRQKM